MQKQLGELFDELKAIKGRDATPKKVELLRKHSSPMLKYMLRLAFAKDLKWMLPEGAPPFKMAQVPAGMGYTNLFAEAKRLYLFFAPENGGHKTVTQTRREILFIELLESLHQSEAELLIAIKDRKLGNKYSITEKIALQAFPDLFVAAATTAQP